MKHTTMGKKDSKKNTCPWTDSFFFFQTEEKNHDKNTNSKK